MATTVHPPPAAAAPAPLTGTQPTYGDTVTTVDPLGRVVSVAEHTGTVGVGGDTVSAATSRQYDASGALVKLMDGAGNQTTSTYDLLGRRTGSVDPDAGASSTAYSDSGFSWATYNAAAANANLYNTTTSTDARSIRVRATTDVLGRTVESDSSPNGTTWSRLSTSLFDDSFDGSGHWPGQLTRSTSFVGATSLTNGTPYVTDVTYDDRMRPTAKKVTIPGAEGALAGAYTFGSAFDDAGHQTSVTYPAAGGLGAETVSTAFDSEGFTGALTSSLAGAPTPLAAAPTFDALGRLTGRTLGTGVGQVATGYSFAGTAQRLSEVTAAVGASTPVVARDDTYLFDSSGNPLSVRDAVAGQSQCYGYDTRNRLVSAFTSGTQTCAPGSGNVVGPDPFKETYAYDPTSNNITSITRGTGTLVTTNQVYAAAGHAHAPSSTTGGVVSGFTYNADGTMATRTGAGAASYTWDAQGRMVSATPQGGSATTMVYNADGSRLLRKDPASTTLYLDGTELKLTGATVAATRYYTHAGTTIGMRTSAGLTWVLGDTQGSFSLTVNAATGAVVRQRYLPYGGLRNTAPVFGTERGWLGKTADTTSGLDYLGARYYDPQLAHFTSPDPLLNAGDPKSYSAYSYANDNPAGASDPTGLRTEKDFYGAAQSAARDSVTSGCDPCGETGSPTSFASDGAPRRVSASPSDLREFEAFGPHTMVYQTWFISGGLLSQSIDNYAKIGLAGTFADTSNMDLTPGQRAIAAVSYNALRIEQENGVVQESADGSIRSTSGSGWDTPGTAFAAHFGMVGSSRARVSAELDLAKTLAVASQTDESAKVPSIYQMNRIINQRNGGVPRRLTRIDPGKVTGEQTHATFDGPGGEHALNVDGTWKHGGLNLTNAEGDWLRKWGWNI